MITPIPVCADTPTSSEQGCSLVIVLYRRLPLSSLHEEGWVQLSCQRTEVDLRSAAGRKGTRLHTHLICYENIGFGVREDTGPNLRLTTHWLCDPNVSETQLHLIGSWWRFTEIIHVKYRAYMWWQVSSSKAVSTIIIKDIIIIIIITSSASQTGNEE